MTDTDHGLPAEPEGAAAPADAKTPDAWAAELGTVPWQHAAAAALHRWAHHAHHAGAPIQLTRGDYEAAASAALEPVPTPHIPALSTLTGA